MTNKSENKYLFSFNTFGSFLTAVLLLFGAASCNNGERGAEDNTLATEQEYNEEPEYENTRENERVTNTETDNFDRWDTNTDRQMDRDEFTNRMNDTGTFYEWDTDQDRTINEDEYERSSRYLQDNRMDTQNNTTGTRGTATNIGTFDELDRNGDGVITEEEFNEAAFNNMDTNRDGTLNNNEYNRGRGNEMNRGTTDETGDRTGGND